MEPKKTVKADLTRRTFLFFNIGLITALLLCIFAFTYRTADENYGIDLDDCTLPSVDEPPVPITSITPPPPRAVVQPVFKVVKDDEPVEDVMPLVDLEDPAIRQAPDVYVTPPVEPEPEESDVIHTFLEEGASPIGGMNGFYKYISQKIKYPARAQRSGTEGRVFVEFVIERDGSISNVKAVTGIGAGCDEEAIRVVKDAPRWNPGKQRGKPVRQRIVLPIYFRLN